MIGTKHTIAAGLAIAQIDTEIKSRGMSYTEGCDFDVLRAMVKKLDGKALTDDFDGRQYDLHAQNAFWIAVYNNKNECISIQAARLEDLGDKSLAKHWLKQQRRKNLNQVRKRDFKLRKNHCPTSHKIKGKVVYHGDFWVRPDCRGDGFAESLVHFGFFVALLRWNFDWIYGLMATRGVHVGFHSRCGYQLAEPYAIDWAKVPPMSFVESDDWLVAAPREYVEHSARVISKLGLKRSPYMRKKRAHPSESAVAKLVSQQ